MNSSLKEIVAAMAPLVSRVRTDVSWVKSNGRQSRTDQPLTDTTLLRHLNGGPARGVVPMRPGQSVTLVALLDFDSHKGQTSWADMQAVALRVMEAMRAIGLRPIPFRSSGGKGIHLYVLWDEPQDAYSVRRRLAEVLAACGLVDGPGGVSRGEVEVFPKQNDIEPGRYGSQFILPLAGESVPLSDDDLREMSREYVTLVDWTTSAPVPHVERAVAPAWSGVETPELDVLKACVRDGIANSGEKELSYDQWRNAVFAIHSATGGSDEGLALAEELSGKASNCDLDFLREQVWPYITDRDGGVTVRTLYAIAHKQTGWVEPIPDVFEPITLSAEEEAEQLLIRARNAERMARSAAATRIDRTDAGNVNLLADIVKGNLRFVPERRAWLRWDGKRWEVDIYGTAAQDSAMEVAEHYHRQAADVRAQAKAATLDDKERKRIEQAADHVEKWAARCRNKGAIDNMLGLAKQDERFTLPASSLDRDPWLFGVANGVVDLRTGELRAAAREDYVTRRSPMAFNRSATCPRWTQFIGEITAKPTAGELTNYGTRPDVADYLQRALGYSLTGSTAEHKMFVAVGDGSNGKNVLLDLMQALMGDYCQTIPPEALMATRHDADAERPSPTAATLAGARAAISSESKDGAKLDVALVKRHTGGGFMTARFMRENTFRFEISHKLWLMTNHRPALDHMDEAMRGRLHLIPFDMKWNRPGHPERDPRLPDGDKDLPAKLKGEAEGVLAWLVEGAVRYTRDGLEPPAAVVAMTREFFQAQDCFARWLARYEACEKGHGTGAKDLFEEFNRWRDAEGESGGPTSQKAFSTKLRDKGAAKHETNAANMWLLRLKDGEA